ncbi:MAG: hypothetical protein RLZZ384_936, partial [Pseudomonadota bacterium]
MEKYILRITKENYFPLEETIYFSSLSLNIDNIRDYSTTAKAWVKLDFINDQLFKIREEVGALEHQFGFSLDAPPQ